MSRLLNEDDVVKIIDEHTDDNGALDNDITCILEDVPSQMSAVEVLEWLVKHYGNRGYKEAFGSEYDLEELLIYTAYSLKPQEIVDRIEKYEEKKHIADANKNVDVTDTNVGNIEPEFKVGDWVRILSSQNYGALTTIKEVCANGRYILNGSCQFYAKSELEHAEPPKEEKQKIEPLKIVYATAVMVDKINELVDAVNELRGV